MDNSKNKSIPLIVSSKYRQVIDGETKFYLRLKHQDKSEYFIVEADYDVWNSFEEDHVYFLKD